MNKIRINSYPLNGDTLRRHWNWMVHRHRYTWWVPFWVNLDDCGMKRRKLT